jgi:phosphatidylglycerophosphate synthase
VQRKSDAEIKAVLAGILQIGLFVCTGISAYAETEAEAMMQADFISESLPFIIMVIITVIGIAAVLRKRKM